jgi:ubiquitin-protein ligase
LNNLPNDILNNNNKHNNMSGTTKRIQNEIKLLTKNPIELIDWFPDEKDFFLWYFLLKGPSKTDYEGGFFIGKIIISATYPTTPIDFVMLTPTGRFEIDKKICLTNSGFHAESWSPIWNMGTILLGFISIMADDTTDGLAHIKRSAVERKALAKASFNYNLTKYPDVLKNFKRFVKTDSNGNLQMLSDEELAQNQAKTKKPKKEIKQPVVDPIGKTKAVDNLTKEINTTLNIPHEPKKQTKPVKNRKN